MVVHQSKTNTSINRYPEIFKFCFEHRQSDKLNILSFGCSNGDEVATLAMFFGESNIYGVDVDPQSLETCRLRFKYIDRIKTSNQIANMQFDMIFCMSVFCKWPDTKELENCSKIYSFQTFEDGLREIDSYLKESGMLVLYNSNFRFEDSSISQNYESIGNFESSGFVTKFSKEHKKLNEPHFTCVFKKNKNKVKTISTN